MKYIFDSIDELIEFVAAETLRTACSLTKGSDDEIVQTIYQRLFGICEIRNDAPIHIHDYVTVDTRPELSTEHAPLPEHPRLRGPFRVGDRVVVRDTKTQKAFVRTDNDGDEYIGTVTAVDKLWPDDATLSGNDVGVLWDSHYHEQYWRTDELILYTGEDQ